MCVVCVGGLWVPSAGAARKRSAATRPLAAIRFLPARNGFGFENYGNTAGITNLGVVQMQSLFGAGVCASGSGVSCVLNPPAEQWMIAENQLMAGGHCEGLAISSLLFARRALNPLVYGGRVPKLRLSRNMSLQGLIAYTYAFGALDSVQQAAITTASPLAIVQQLIAVLRAGQEQWVLHIYKPDMSGGHAVTPYEVDSLGHGQYAIRIYDNNWPGQVRTITVNGTTDTWSYEAAQNPHDLSELYTGTATTDTLQLWNSTPGLGVQPCPFCVPATAASAAFAVGVSWAPRWWALAPAAAASARRSAGRIAVVLAGEGAAGSRARLLVRNRAGRRVGLTARGRFVDTLPGTQVRFLTSGGVKSWTDPPVPLVSVPDTGSYAMSLEGRGSAGSARQALSLIGPGFSGAVESLALVRGDRSRVTMSRTGAMSFGSVSGSGQSPRLLLGVAGRGGNYMLAVAPAGLAGGQAVGMAVDRQGGNLAITPPSRGAVQIAFQVDRENSDGTADVFASGPVVSLRAGQGTTVVRYGAWPGGTAPMTIQQGSGPPQLISDRPALAVEQDPNGGFGAIPATPPGAPAGAVRVSSASPSSLAQGAGARDLTISGRGFQKGARVVFSNPGVTVNSTRFVDSKRLIVNVSIAPTAPVGPGDVTISDPGGGSGTGAGVFTVDAAPAVTGAVPAAGERGASGLAVTIAGAGFQPGAQVAFSNPGITVNSTAVVDASQLVVNITIAPEAALGPGDVMVSNPDGTTATGTFTVDPAPTITAVTRNDGEAGQTLSVTVTGTGFEPGAQVSFANPQITVTSTDYVDASHVIAGVSIAARATPGPTSVTLTNPDATSVTFSGSVYWTGKATNAIGRANLDGSDPDPTFIQNTLSGVPTGIAAGGGEIFWTEQSAPDAWRGRIGEAALDGTELNESLVAFADAGVGVATDGRHLYWATAAGTIARSRMDGSDIDLDFISPRAGRIEGVAVSGGNIYWGEPNRNAIGRARLGDPYDTIATTFITGLGAPAGVAATAGHVYWANQASDSIGRANLDGSSPDPTWITGATGATGVSLDGTYIYWANTGGNTIGRAPLANPSAADQSFISGAGQPSGTAVTPAFTITPSGRTDAQPEQNGDQ
jgi:hypothetical protein